MELREAMGRRRSIRFLRPHQPVEPEKIQIMLEAARRASHWGNVGGLRAIVVHRESAPQETLDALFAPIAGYQIRRAPVIIVWFFDADAVDEQSSRLQELLDVGALGVGENKQTDLDEKILPFFDRIREALKGPGMNDIDSGQGIAQATLMAYELGLGTCCLGTPDSEEIRSSLGLPDSCRVLMLQTVGYPAEHWEAGGQRPRQPFGDLFHMNEYGNPYPRSDEVIEELTEDAFFTRPGPLPWREAELEWLKEALDVPGSGLI
ncbi:MAG: hypothetical protein GY724_11765 [Actinomycetia bacterium]|nr:hypothetical protein [Actinomycetes bacterium]MCP5035802.1 hypothetical protein [Actinomycetes bacterium]